MTATTLADVARTCRERAQALLDEATKAEDLAREYGHRGNGPSARFRADAADWQALADLLDAVDGSSATAFLVPPYIAAAQRLVARLDRP